MARYRRRCKTCGNLQPESVGYLAFCPKCKRKRRHRKFRVRVRRQEEAKAVDIETAKLAFETLELPWREVEDGGIEVRGLYFWPDVSRWSKTNNKPVRKSKRCSIKQFIRKVEAASV